MRRAYSDVEESVGSFLDQLDFYLGKVTIFQNIVKDVRQLYKVLKAGFLFPQKLLEMRKNDRQ